MNNSQNILNTSHLDQTHVLNTNTCVGLCRMSTSEETCYQQAGGGHRRCSSVRDTYVEELDLILKRKQSVANGLDSGITVVDGLSLAN